jgi:hypothetical protein
LFAHQDADAALVKREEGVFVGATSSKQLTRF